MSLFSEVQAARAAMALFIEIMKGGSTDDVDLSPIGGVTVPSYAKAVATAFADKWQGVWNANINNPALATGVGIEGYMYTVSVAGATNLDGITQWNAKDIAVFHGGHWYKIDGLSAEVVTVSGRIGNVTAAQLAQDIFVGSNLIEANVASAATLDLSTVTTPKIRITGTTNIGAITAPPHALFFVRFAGTLTITYNATSLMIPGNLDLITKANDTAIVTTDGSGNVRIRHYTRAAQTPDELISGAIATTVASASTLDLSAITTPKINVTGTTTINAITVPANSIFFVRFQSALTLTYDATSLILPAGVDIAVKAGDCALFSSDASGNVRLRHYQPYGQRVTNVQMPGTSANVAAGPVALALGYNGIRNTSGGILTCNLPVPDLDGDLVTLKDEFGNAGDGTHAFRMYPASGQIEGHDYLEITVNYGWRKVRWCAFRTAWLQVP
jgi:hypothetical protein